MPLDHVFAYIFENKTKMRDSEIRSIHKHFRTHRQEIEQMEQQSARVAQMKASQEREQTKV